jgi:uncharacterized protein (TIGR03437 family)
MRLQKSRSPGWGRFASIVVAIVATSLCHAASSGFSAVLGSPGTDYANAVASDGAGNTYVAGVTYSSAFPVTPGAFQTTFGGSSDAFVAKLGPDGKLVWSTFLGGLLADAATGIALDGAGNVLVTGYTSSPGFPLAHPLMGTLNNGASATNYDAFVAKLDPTGSKLLYSTFLGGPMYDYGWALATDASGSVYVAGLLQDATGFPGFQPSTKGFGIFVSKLDPQGSLVYSFFHPTGTAAAIAVDAAGSAYVTGIGNRGGGNISFGPAGTEEAIVFKLSPDGSHEVFETTLGGSDRTEGTAIALDRTGAVYIGGMTASVDFPLVKPLQKTLGARPLWKSTDSGNTWTPLDDLPFAFIQVILAEPADPNTLYATTSDAGAVKTTDGGATWSKINNGIAVTNLQALAIDPLHLQTLYVATNPSVAPGVIYKSVDGGSNWTIVDSSAAAGVLQLAVDARSPNTVYAVWNNHTTRKSMDGGATWSMVVLPQSWVTYLAVDLGVSGNLYAYSAEIVRSLTDVTPEYTWHSTDGGTTWLQVPPSPNDSEKMLIDASTAPSIVYNALSSRSTDGGVTWTSLSPPGSSNTPIATGPVLGPIAVDAAGTLYAAIVSGTLVVSRDHGQSWTPIGAPVPPSPYQRDAPTNVISIVPTSNTATVYAAVQNRQTSGFLTKLSPDGSTILYSTYLRGHDAQAPIANGPLERAAIIWENGVTAVALDAAGNVVLAGNSRASDFPQVYPVQLANGGRGDAMVAAIAADGSKLLYSTYLGGSQDDGAFALALDPQGYVVIAGQTWSADFPVTPGMVPGTGQFGDAFVAKIATPGPPAISRVLNGASFQPGIESGSWVMIQGTNLARSARSWTAAEIASGHMPTALDGVSATINSKPAFVYYISPTQINVQAPTDDTLGPVDVVVTNNGTASAPATAQLQLTAPALFRYPGTNYAIASLLPDYSLVGNPAAPAHPGDIVVLWGTGFGATNPAVPAGVAASGTPFTVAVPAMTLGGIKAHVLSALLTAGSAGLYQVTIQIPASAPSGALEVGVSSGEVTSSTGASIIVKTP